jgi:PIN domain nuclease of toxin-antitoxin system
MRSAAVSGYPAIHLYTASWRDERVDDTQVFIWWLESNKKLSSKTNKLLANPHGFAFLSVATIWEMVIKKSTGKLKPIKPEHVLALEKLPLHHKDPFDRILVAQSQSEKLTLITADSKITQYKVKAIKT